MTGGGTLVSAFAAAIRGAAIKLGGGCWVWGIAAATNEELDWPPMPLAVRNA